MYPLLLNGQILSFFIVLAAIVFSLSFHEWGHAYAAKRFGDDTAERMGRLTLNPVAHIDPIGLVMVVLIGFGYAKPVPVDPRKLDSMWADLIIAGAGPFMNLLIAFVLVNLYVIGLDQQWAMVASPIGQESVQTLIYLNVLLMLFNLLPFGPLDGHYILPYFLPRRAALWYRHWNARYGAYGLLALVMLSVLGLPIFSWIRAVAVWLIPRLAVLA